MGPGNRPANRRHGQLPQRPDPVYSIELQQQHSALPLERQLYGRHCWQYPSGLLLAEHPDGPAAQISVIYSVVGFTGSKLRLRAFFVFCRCDLWVSGYLSRWPKQAKMALKLLKFTW